MRQIVIAVILMLLSPTLGRAHFIWLLNGQPKPEKLQVFFGESAEPDDPKLLDKIATAEAWVMGGREPKPLSLVKTADAFEADLTGSAQHATVILRHTYGIAAKGTEPFLLKYYAKAYPTPLPGSWKAVSDKERLPLEVTPILAGKEVKLKVIWQGKPQASAVVTVVGPGIADKLEGPTDDAGLFVCELPKAGTYSIRAKHVEETSGKHDDKEYKSVRHYSTLTLPYLPLQLKSVAHEFPALSKGTTSFGGAIAGDSLFVYGGNYGSSHEYANEDQSGDLWKLDLKQPTLWKKVSSGTKLQGLAMVEYQGSLIRVGGFTALNKAGTPEDLRSQTEVAKLKADGSWEPLVNLPQPRSSHDAVVLGDSLYVVGGWNMQGGGKNATWQESLLSLNLAADKPEWKTLAPPSFQRRALALAAWQGKLYCVGGMEMSGGPTTDVAIYDPAKDVWSSGPRLLGTAMDGFGAAAFACGDSLYVSTYSGSLQRLTGNGNGWELVGQLAHPRFFHRMLPWGSKLVIVGGSDMTTGKVEKLEIVETTEK